MYDYPLEYLLYQKVYFKLIHQKIKKGLCLGKLKSSCAELVNGLCTCQCN